MPAYILMIILTPLKETTMAQKVKWLKFWEKATNSETRYVLKLQEQLKLIN